MGSRGTICTVTTFEYFQEICGTEHFVDVETLGLGIHLPRRILAAEVGIGLDILDDALPSLPRIWLNLANVVRPRRDLVLPRVVERGDIGDTWPAFHQCVPCLHYPIVKPEHGCIYQFTEQIFGLWGFPFRRKGGVIGIITGFSKGYGCTRCTTPRTVCTPPRMRCTPPPRTRCTPSLWQICLAIVGCGL